METTHQTFVAAREYVTENMVRITLTLAEGSEWASTGVGDEFIHVEVGAQSLDPDGHSARHYTVSGLVDGGLHLEAFLHGDGPGARWAREVPVGAPVLISDPKDYYEPPSDAGTRVLVGDATAVPGIARILADAAADERFHVIVELSDMADARDFVSAAAVTVSWRIAGNGKAPSQVVDALTLVFADGFVSVDESPYVWVACESKVSRAARKALRHEVGLPIAYQRIVGYWHDNHEEIESAWAALSDDLKAQYLAIWREDRTDEENWLELEPFLESVGQ